MENNDFFTQEEHKQLILLYKRLLRLSKDTLQKDDCHKLKTHLVKAMAEGTIPRNVFQMNPITGTVSQQSLERTLILRGRDNQNLPDPR